MFERPGKALKGMPTIVVIIIVVVVVVIIIELESRRTRLPLLLIRDGTFSGKAKSKLCPYRSGIFVIRCAWPISKLIITESSIMQRLLLRQRTLFNACSASFI
jgi:uncharacterized membrane protein YqiK